jgi:hypothetical protein
MLALNAKIYTPVNPTAIPGIVSDIALDADFFEPDPDDLSSLSSAQD